MSTGEGEDPRNLPGQRDGDNRARRGGDSIGVGGGDDSVSRIQLAARWAEAYAKDGDSLASTLKRFRVAYEYIDAVIHGVDTPELDSEVPEPAAQPAPAAYAPPPPQWSSPAPAPPAESPPSPWSRPTEPGAPPPAAPPPEQKPWG